MGQACCAELGTSKENELKENTGYLSPIRNVEFPATPPQVMLMLGIMDPFPTEIDEESFKKMRSVKLNGKLYKGQFNNDIPHGFGKELEKSTGFYYEGNFANGKREGKGRLFSNDGSYFQGDFKADNPYGKGIFLRGDNDAKYEGQFTGFG